jgi:hypothetical protein
MTNHLLLNESDEYDGTNTEIDCFNRLYKKEPSSDVIQNICRNTNVTVIHGPRNLHVLHTSVIILSSVRLT